MSKFVVMFVFASSIPAYAVHDDEDDIAGPVLGFVMGDTLTLNGDPLHLDTESLGDWSVQGMATGLTFRQTNPVSINESSYSGFSNAQVIIQKTDGPVRLFAQTGIYTIPTLGMPFMRAQPTTEGSFGYVPHAYVSFLPNSNWSLAIGKIPSMGGVEATFTYENPNIQRGLLWVQTNSVSRGMQLSFQEGMFSAAFTWNDG
ncbi:MAG: outer membrane beta-barrel protein, partial [Fluviibacter sp.]